MEFFPSTTGQIGMQSLFFVASFITFLATTSLYEPNGQVEEMTTDTIEIVLETGSQDFVAILNDNPTSQSLIAQMPFTTELEDYAGLEKIFYPQQSLSRERAPAGADPSTGDIMYYAPWGDVAIFYKDFGYAKGLIPLGKMSDVAGFVQALKSDRTVTFRRK